jgi:hypothetical protein
MEKYIGSLARPGMSLKKKISRFHQDTLDQLSINLTTQQVWPTEVYPGYRQVNEYRKRHGGWYSTGEGARSFQGKVVSADRIDNISLHYSYNEYMRFAELGVGKGVSAEDVERSKNVNYKSRYISSWDRSAGRSHRPSIRSEFNHLARRIELYLLDFYGYEITAHVVKGVEMDINLANELQSLGVW